MAPNPNFTARLDPTVLEAGRKAARNSGRSLTALVEQLLIEHCKAQGTLPPDWVPERPRRRQG